MAIERRNVRRTFGVEEELLLVHRDHASPTAAGQAVVGATQGILAADDSPLGAGSVDLEFKQEQAEIGSEPVGIRPRCARSSGICGGRRRLGPRAPAPGSWRSAPAR